MKISKIFLLRSSLLTIIIIFNQAGAVDAKAHKKESLRKLQQSVELYRNKLVKNNDYTGNLVKGIKFRVVESYSPLAQADITKRTITFSDQLYNIITYLADISLIPAYEGSFQCNSSYKDYVFNNIVGSFEGLKIDLLPPAEYFRLSGSFCKRYASRYSVGSEMIIQRDNIVNGIFYYIMLHEIAHIRYEHRYSRLDYERSQRNEYAADAWSAERINKEGFPLLYAFNPVLFDYMVMVPLALDCKTGVSDDTHPSGLNRIDRMAKIYLDHPEAAINPSIKLILIDTSRLASKARVEFSCSR